jgi:hypothetical protein
LIDNYSKEVVIDKSDKEEKLIKVYDLRDEIDPKRFKVEYLGDYVFSAS